MVTLSAAIEQFVVWGKEGRTMRIVSSLSEVDLDAVAKVWRLILPHPVATTTVKEFGEEIWCRDLGYPRSSPDSRAS